MDFNTRYLAGYFVIAETRGRYDVGGFYAPDINRASEIQRAFVADGRSARIIHAGTLRVAAELRAPPTIDEQLDGRIDDDSDALGNPVEFIEGFMTPWGEDPEEGTGRAMGL